MQRPDVCGKKARLYVISDGRTGRGGDLFGTVTGLLAPLPPGAAMLQLREKHLSARDLVTLARQLRTVTEPRRCPLLLNDRLDVALAAGADGVHLPEQGLDVASARRLAGPQFLIGASTHSPQTALARAGEGADVIVCGPIWSTPSKAAFGSPLGTEVLSQAAAAVADAGASLFAIGGIDSPHRARVAAACGAHGIAAIRVFFSTAKPGRAALEIYRALRNDP